MCVGRLFERQTIVVINKVMFVSIYIGTDYVIQLFY